jgi:hypothetical protein
MNRRGEELREGRDVVGVDVGVFIVDGELNEGRKARLVRVRLRPKYGETVTASSYAYGYYPLTNQALSLVLAVR